MIKQTRQFLSKRRIQEKFTFIVTVASTVALAMVAISIAVYEIYSYNSNLLEELDIQGGIVKEHLDVAINFGDEISAAESLSAFSTNPNILSALVITLDGSIFASYATPGNRAPALLPTAAGYHFTKNTLVLVKEISDANQVLGLLLIEHEIPPLISRLTQYFPLFAISVLTLALMTLIVSQGSKRFIVQPMIQLTRTASHISLSHDYSIRSDFESDDEIGTLSSTLNELLDVTENHRNTLLTANAKLEEQAIELESQRQDAENARRDYESLAKNHELLLVSAGEGIIELDKKGIISFANPKAASILDLSKSRILGYSISHFFIDNLAQSQGNAEPDSQLPWQRSAIFRAMRSGSECKIESEVWLSARNAKFHIGYSFTPILDEARCCTGGVLMFQDITARKKADRRLMEMANNDPLTGLSNRRYFYDALSKAMSRIQRSERFLAILYIDIDHFKQINDTYGHEAGDHILLSVAEVLKGCIRSGDVLSRLAGDEFAVLLFDIHSPADAQNTAEKILDNLSAPHMISNRQVFAHPSIGIAMYPGVGETCDDVLRAADAAMYQVKKMGRSGIQFFEASLQTDIENRNRIIQALNNSTFDDEFSIVYQPKFSLTLNKLIGMEALLRWKHAGEEISPDVFIPIAEESGKICDIGEWVLHTVCKQVSHWQNNIPQCKDLCVAINVSPRQLRSGDFDITIDQALQKSRLAPQWLEIEITETAAMEDPEAVIDELCRIRDLGVKISIDDFGTGYSSLNYLKRLPISELKIDKSFTMDIGNNKHDEAIVRAVIAIAHSLYIDVIAEGVETLEQLTFLDRNHCDKVQGYHFSKPLSVAEFENLFAGDSWKYESNFSALAESRKCLPRAQRLNQDSQ